MAHALLQCDGLGHVRPVCRSRSARRRPTAMRSPWAGEWQARVWVSGRVSLQLKDTSLPCFDVFRF